MMLNLKWVQGAIAGTFLVLFPLTALSPAASYDLYDLFDVRDYRDDHDPSVFRQCAFELKEAGIDAASAMVACADALVPEDLSHCVWNITQKTEISPNTSLLSCYQVRRPVDLAACVVSIQEEVFRKRQAMVQRDRAENPESEEMTKQAEIAPEELFLEPDKVKDYDRLELAVLDRCRRSLLPKRYAACVVGLSQEVPFIPLRIMDSCISAEDFPRELYRVPE